MAKLQPDRNFGLAHADMTARLNSLSILVVEHDPELLQLYRRLLHGLGARRMWTVRSQRDAERAILKHRPDLLFACHRPPEIEAVALSRWLRRGKVRPDAAIMLCAPELTRDLALQARDAGIDEIIAHPVTIGAVADRIHAAIAHRRAFIRSNVYAGPCRRRRNRPGDGYIGPWRRADDAMTVAAPAGETDAFQLDI